MTVYDLLDAWYTKFEAYGSERNKQGQLSVVAQASYRGATSPRHFDIRVGFNEYANSPGKRIATAVVNEKLEIERLNPDQEATIAEWNELAAVYKATKEATPA